MNNIATNILTTLNTAQREAVTAKDSNLLVLAGAGSGKTRVLTHRTAWLINQQQISPFAILAVTFTNKAANEMRERIEKLISLPTNGMWIGTFHSLAHRLLRIHWQDANLPESFQIIDAEDQYRLIRRSMKNLNLSEDHWPPKKVQWYINHNKDEGRRPQHIEPGHDHVQQTMLAIYTEYEKNCQQSGLVDFAELLLRSQELWLNKPQILNHYRNRFQHILIDEFQDTNTLQYAWIRILTTTNNNIMVVGDDDQSIYGWRGAKIDNIHNFARDFQNLKIVRLEQNYRSSNNILKVANAVIAANTTRLGKNLWTAATDGEPVSLYAAYNDRDEANFIINNIQKLHRQQKIKRNECAILYRSNAQSRILEEALIQQGIPYRIYGGTRFFERAEIKNALGYLRLIANQNDDAAFERIVNTPTRSIGNTTLAEIRRTAHDKEISLWQTARFLVNKDLLTARANNAVSNFLHLIKQLAVEITNLPLHEQVDHVIQLSGLCKLYAKNKDEKNRMRLDNLKELISSAKEFATNVDITNDSTILTAFLTHAALEAGEIQSTDANGDYVQLMTIHAAKGLEFPVVFITGLEEGLFPHKMSMDSHEGLEEERRLCYVGITRAMKKLYLTHANSRMLHGFIMNQIPSQFLNSLPPKCISEEQMYIQVSPSKQYKHDNKSPTFTIATKNTSSNTTDLHPGQTVFHKKFGEGTIINFISKNCVQVNFKRYGSKTLDLNFAKLKVIE